MKKEYVLDTNLPMYDPNCIYKFEDNDLIFCTVTLKELDHNKTRNSESGRNAREFTRMLDELTKSHNILEGIPIYSDIEGQKGTLRMETYDSKILDEIRDKFAEIDNDDRILSVAVRKDRNYKTTKFELEDKITSLEAKLRVDVNDKVSIEREIEQLKEKLTHLKPVILVTKDANLRVRANAFGITVQDFKSDKVYNKDRIFRGWQIIQVEDTVIADYYTQTQGGYNKATEYSSAFGKPFDLESLGVDISEYDFMPNEYAILVGESHGELTEDNLYKLYIENKDNLVVVLKYNAKTKQLHSLNDYTKYLAAYNVFPRNLQQKMVVDMMFDIDKPFKTVNGIAGTGKTLFALLCSIIMVNDLKWFDEIVITRPIVPMEEDIGYLPGDEQQKIEPYMRSFTNNLKVILYNKQKAAKKNDLTMEMAQFKIRAVAPTYLRGNTLPRTIVICDEGQNGTRHFWKTITTRMGEGSMFVGIGDIDQIDHPYLDSTNCGLAYAIEVMKDEEIAEHCNMVIGERSELSNVIARKWK